MSFRKNLGHELNRLEERAGQLSGRRYWRSLDELSGSPAFQELLKQEFPLQADVWPESLSRRKFLGLMGASLALAGLNGCSVRPAPSIDVVPYVHPPEEVVPGKPLFYASTMCCGPDAVGVLVENHMGRPTKIEGNPNHPASRGGTSPLVQASILELYDPDRGQVVRHLGQERTWEDAGDMLRAAMAQQRLEDGAGMRLLTGSVLSPTLTAQIQTLLKQLPKARWHAYEPLERDAVYAGSELAFGERLAPRYDFSKADVVLALDADFLVSGPGHIHYAGQFMDRRRVRTTVDAAGQAAMNRLYVVESAVTCTGAKADHRLAIRASEIDAFARALAARVGVLDAQAASEGGQSAVPPLHGDWIAAVAKDLEQHAGRSLVIVGERQPAAVHLLAHAINDRLKNIGQTVEFTEPIEQGVSAPQAGLAELVGDMKRDRVDFLLILDTNAAFTAPVDLEFARHLQRVPLRVYLGLHEDETSRQCHWHLPQTHYLEAWSDARAFDGTASIVQPLVEPLYHGHSAHEVFSILLDGQETPGLEIVRRHWEEQWSGSPAISDRWQIALHDGVIEETRVEPKSVTLAADWKRHFAEAEKHAGPGMHASPAARSGELELNFLPDPTIYDGRFANNGWLQELPKPVTQLTWGNVALMSLATAHRFGIAMDSYAHGGEHGGYYMQVVELTSEGRPLRVPAWIMPGHADGCVTLYLGYGRERSGRIGGSAEEPLGADAYLLRTSERPWFSPGLKLRVTGERELVTCTQEHHSMEEREPVRSFTLAEYQREPNLAPKEQQQKRTEIAAGLERPLTLYESFDYGPPKNKWGMIIDLTTCVGCNACVVACQAENNIPVVGKDQVSRGREMHWLRVDRYVSGSAEDPAAFHFQPLPCMHCENAPCEYVCPVEATLHSAEGLNEMVYNRCVGTRFCSNNCPYKVRRFNFLEYADYKTVPLRMQYNPDVTVRSRGVMEKCSYCVQRIRHAVENADAEHRSIADLEVLTACQAACPAKAISFGDLNNKQSQVNAWKQQPLNYGLLADLNTTPRTTYLAAVTNPNEKLINAEG